MHLPVTHRILIWIAVEATEGRLHREQKLRAESGQTLFVPIESFCQLRFTLGPNDQLMAQARLRTRSRTNSQGDPASGLRW